MSLGYFGATGTLGLLEDRWTQSLRTGWTRSDADNSNEFGANGSTDADRYACLLPVHLAVHASQRQLGRKLADLGSGS